jgi:hypothetical protein
MAAAVTVRAEGGSIARSVAPTLAERQDVMDFQERPAVRVGEGGRQLTGLADAVGVTADPRLHLRITLVALTGCSRCIWRLLSRGMRERTSVEQLVSPSTQRTIVLGRLSQCCEDDGLLAQRLPEAFGDVAPNVLEHCPV